MGWKKITNVLVTGGLGFIGSNFCRHLLRSHKDIRIVNLDKIGVGANPANLQDIAQDPRYRFTTGSICDASLLVPLVKNADVVVNFAAETHVDRSIASPEVFLENNTLGTFTLLEALRKFNDKAKIVQVSTDEVYGDAIEGSFTEADPLTPSNPYSASKAAAEMFTMAYQRTYKLNAIVTRCTNNYGPYQFPEKLIPKTIIRAISNLPIPIYGKGLNVRSWLYVVDHCEAIELIVEKGKTGQIYNISAGNEYPNLEIVQKILSLLNRPTDLIAFVPDRPGHDLRYSLDATRLRRDLGWRPSSSFEESLAATVQWYQENEAWWRPLATDAVLHPQPWTQR